MAEKAARIAKSTRTTNETDITLEFNIDGKGQSKIDTGIGFFDHMLTSFAKHGFFDLNVTVKGDLYVDCHHTIEDVGMCWQGHQGGSWRQEGHQEIWQFLPPMDADSRNVCHRSVGRPYLVYDLNLRTERVGYFDTQMVKEFLYAVSYAAEMNLNIKQFSGENDHHIIEAAFKAFAKALDEATTYDRRLNGKVLSTKGTL